MIRSAGIIAAGEGSRFKQSGIPLHKPMIPVNGIPLIGHAIRKFESVGVERLAIIFNEAERECVDWVRVRFPEMRFDFIVQSTASSFESFWLVGTQLGPGRHLISTVDSICSEDELRKMADFPVEGDREVALGVTSFVQDEKPLWVDLDRDARIREIGARTGRFATAGFYSVSHEHFARRPSGEIASLRFYLKWLLNQGFPFRAVPLSDVVDVDTPEDIVAAEKLLKGGI